MSLLAGLVGAAGPTNRRLPPSLREVGFDQRLNEQVPLDLAFKDESGPAVSLGDYFGTASRSSWCWPTSAVRCSAREVLNGLVRAMLDMPLDAGKDFDVVTVSFDPRETPEHGGRQEEDLPGALRPARSRRRLALPHRRAGADRAADRGRRLSLQLRRRATTSSPMPAASWC